MAHAIILDRDLRAILTSQIRDSLPVGLRPAADAIAIGDTLEVWTLSKLSDGFDTMQATATRTNSYHHQLLAHGAAVGFARSQPIEGGESREVTRVVRSPLGERIDRAWHRVEQLVPGDEIARLVTVPQYQVVVFWFASVNKCYVVSCPDTLNFLRSDEWLDGADFLSGLRKETPIEGALAVRK